MCRAIRSETRANGGKSVNPCWPTARHEGQSGRRTKRCCCPAVSMPRACFLCITMARGSTPTSSCTQTGTVVIGVGSSVQSFVWPALGNVVLFNSAGATESSKSGRGEEGEHSQHLW